MGLSGACQVSRSGGRGWEEGMANEGNKTVKGYLEAAAAAPRWKPGRGSNPGGKANNGRLDRKLLIYRRLMAISGELNH
jgi:hypothetical protein